jgi:hypothetical protein
MIIFVEIGNLVPMTTEIHATLRFTRDIINSRWHGRLKFIVDNPMTVSVEALNQQAGNS